jgi:hypothetical protein
MSLIFVFLEKDVKILLFPSKIFSFFSLAFGKYFFSYFLGMLQTLCGKGL